LYGHCPVTRTRNARRPGGHDARAVYTFFVITLDALVFAALLLSAGAPA
jgi:hypothetical protein